MAERGPTEALAVTFAARIFAQRPEGYSQSVLHGTDRDFRETNCYVDLCIEVLHALGLDPHACLGFTLASDYEGDQWTFFKPPHGDLDRLYGIDVEELTLWRSLLEHAQTQVSRQHLPVVEVDAYFLPDTSGTDYKKQHVKTTIAITEVDPVARSLVYFHNAGLYRLFGDDFTGIFRQGLKEHDDCLPPYCEIIKTDRVFAAPPPALRDVSRNLARHHFARRPRRNPVELHAQDLARDMELIAKEGAATYHAYSFAVVRQLGANFELAASYLRWLDREGGALANAADSFAMISSTAKRVILKLARVAHSGRPTDLSESFVSMARAWTEGMDRLASVLS
jgi:hypothetical protein